jgi:hypothetical protein
MAMRHNQATARVFFSRDGGLTYIKMLEGTRERWSDEAELASGQIGLPVVFIRERLADQQ